MENQTSATYFVLLGFSDDPLVQIFLFVMFLCVYAATLMGNVVIFEAIRTNAHLHSPMYFFLSHLAVLDVCFSSVTVPRALMNLCSSQTISYYGCIAQTFFIFLTGSTEVFLLSVMAYDRYAAICKPLYYAQIMNREFCRGLVGGAWAMGFMHSLVNTLPLLKLMFCSSSVIRHFSCEFPSLVPLSCTDTFTIWVTFYITFTTVGLLSFAVILVSYIHIISTVVKMHSVEAKKRTFSTCSSHLIVVILYYSSGCFRYLGSSVASSVVLNELLSIQYSIATPLLNPIIYSLKTKTVKEAIKNLLGYKPLISHHMSNA
ncbi:olfactory receptor 8S1-like [Tiliqua scincoides]|uniref:olfactory receptor 8S1-like n=1 Tax=Tiliqua scincoides TaxID=71010 RepID=UPI00346298EE